MKRRIHREKNSKVFIVEKDDDWKKDPLYTFWLTESSKGDGFSHCKVCSMDIISASGSIDIKKHAMGRKHKDNISAKALQLLSSVWSVASNKSNHKNKMDCFSNLFDENESLSPPPSPKSPSVCPYTYRKEWEQIPMFSNWLLPSEKGDDYGFCKLCSSHLALYISGISSLKSHASCQKHLQAEASLLSIDNGGRICTKKTKSKSRMAGDVEPDCDDEISKISESTIPCSFYTVRNSTSQKNKDIPEQVPNNKTSKKGFGRHTGYYLYKYQTEWESHLRYSKWLSPSELGPAYAFCKCCDTDLTIMASGKTALDRHAFSKKHRKAQRNAYDLTSISEIVPQVSSVSIEVDSSDKQVDEIFLDIKDEETCFISEGDISNPFNEIASYEDLLSVEEQSTYLGEWEKNSLYKDWLAPSAKGDKFAYCKVCKMDIMIHKLAEVNLKIHALSKDHKLRLSSKEPISKFEVGNGIQIEIKDPSSSKIAGELPHLDVVTQSSFGFQGTKKQCLNALDPSTSSQGNHLKCKSEKIMSEYYKQYGYKEPMKYNYRWERDPLFAYWIAPSSKGKYFASCIYCSCDLSIYTGGKGALERHAKTPKHQKNADAGLLLESNEVCNQLDEPTRLHEDQSPKMKGTKKFIQYYNPLWEKDPDLKSWLSTSELGREYAYCKACLKNLLIRGGRKADLISHSKSRKHLRLMKLLLNPNEESNTLNESSLSEAIKRELPRIDDALITKLARLIIDELGVEDWIDLQHLEIEDFEKSFLKPIQTRKLIQSWRKYSFCKKGNTTVKSSSDARVENLSTFNLPCSSTNMVNAIHLETNMDCGVTSLVQEPVHHNIQVHLDQQQQLHSSSGPLQPSSNSLHSIRVPLQSSNIPLQSSSGSMHSSNYSLQATNGPLLHPSFEQVNMDPHNLQNFDLSNVESICLEDDLPPPVPTAAPPNCIPEPQSPKRSKNEDQGDMGPDPDKEINMKKSIWVDDFCVPSDHLTPEALNLLQSGEKLVEPHLSDLVRAFANQIYEIVKKPHIDDLRIISRKVTCEFPALQDTKGNCPYRTFFEKLKNRMYTLRKRKSACLRRERKKLLKQMLN